MIPDLSANTIHKYRNNAEIISETASQIIKDFALFGIPIEFPLDMDYAYDSLYSQMHYHISRLWDNNCNNLVSLLYRIDLSEKTIQLHKGNNPDVPVVDIITELTILRELKKVLTRRHFKQQSVDENKKLK